MFCIAHSGYKRPGRKYCSRTINLFPDETQKMLMFFDKFCQKNTVLEQIFWNMSELFLIQTSRPGMQNTTIYSSPLIAKVTSTRVVSPALGFSYEKSFNISPPKGVSTTPCTKRRRTFVFELSPSSGTPGSSYLVYTDFI